MTNLQVLSDPPPPAVDRNLRDFTWKRVASVTRFWETQRHHELEKRQDVLGLCSGDDLRCSLRDRIWNNSFYLSPERVNHLSTTSPRISPHGFKFTHFWESQCHHELEKRQDVLGLCSGDDLRCSLRGRIWNNSFYLSPERLNHFRGFHNSNFATRFRTELFYFISTWSMFWSSLKSCVLHRKPIGSCFFAFLCIVMT